MPNFLVFILIFIGFLQLIDGQTRPFSNPLQRFIYDEQTKTIIVAAVNRLYSLNASNLALLTELDASTSLTEPLCPITLNRTLTTKLSFDFPHLSHLHSTNNATFNQILLLLPNRSILICSTSNRGGACQLRTVMDLHLLKNSSQRLVTSSPFYPSAAFVSEMNRLLYIATTYDSQCDPFYEIPTISGRQILTEPFLAPMQFNTGQSALQQTSNTLRLFNVRLVKEFFLHYVYAFEYKHFSFLLTIQQADLHQKYRLQTKIIRFCQTLKQPMMKSYVEIPLTCGENYPYIVHAKYSPEQRMLYGLFRNTIVANLNTTSHALCQYPMEQIQQGFFDAVKRCLVDGKGSRGLGFLSPDTACVTSKVSEY